MMEQTQQEIEPSVDKPEVRQLSQEDREVIKTLARRIDDGAKMAEIFGLDDQTMIGLEVQGYRLYRSGCFDQARVACRGVLALDGDRRLARLLLGDMALQEYRFADAVEHLEKVYELEPERTAVRARLGEALLKWGDAERARPHLEAVAGGEGGPTEEEQRRCQALLDVIGR